MEENFSAEKLKIVEFNLVKGQIDSPIGFKKNYIEKYDTDMSFNIALDSKKKIITAEIGFVIKTKSKKKQKESKASFNFIFAYSVENFEELVTYNDDRIEDLSIRLLTSIAAISFSTSRGILITRFQGTAMKDYILPIIKPSELLMLSDDEEE